MMPRTMMPRIMMPPSFSSEYVRARRSSRRRSTRRAIPRPISLAAASRLALIRATRPTPAASWANASTGRCCSTRRPRSSCAPSLSLDFMKPTPHARLDRKSASCSPSHRTMCWSLLGARAAASSIESLNESYVACVQSAFVRRLDDFGVSNLPGATGCAFIDCQLEEDALFTTAAASAPGNTQAIALVRAAIEQLKAKLLAPPRRCHQKNRISYAREAQRPY
jgi:hypothetical protein